MKTQRIERVIRALRIRPTSGKHRETLGDIRAVHDRWHESRIASGPHARVMYGWAARLAVAVAIAVVVYLAVAPRSSDKMVPNPRPAGIVTAGSLQAAFCRDGLEGVERQLDRAVELRGPWPADLSVQGLL